MNPADGAHPGALERPLFLVGAERSGSTLLRLMLDHHPRVAFEHEFDVALSMVSDEGELPPMAAYHDMLRTTRGVEYQIDESLSYTELVSDFLRQKQLDAGGKELVGATLHHHFDRALHVWPDARFIHLIRDPRDVTLSVLQKGWAGNLYHAAQWWLDAEACWDVLAARLSPDRYVEVRYEDLVTRPEQVLTRVCEFIGIAYDASMLDYGRNAVQYPRPDPQLARQWPSRMSGAEIELIEARLWPAASRRDYEASCPSPRRVGPIGHSLRMLDSRTRRFMMRLRRYGAFAIACDLAGRRLGFSALARLGQHLINDIDAKLIAQEAAGLRAPSSNIAPVVDPPDEKPLQPAEGELVLTPRRPTRSP